MAARYRARVGERIRDARKARNWSQARLAREMPGTLDAASISRWESGRVEPRADNLQALADALEVDPAYFLMPEPEPGTGDLMRALAGGAESGNGESRLDRLERQLAEVTVKLDLLLERAGGMDPADLTDTIVSGFEVQLGKQPATGRAARGTGKPSGAKPESPPARARGKRQAG